MVGMPPTYCKLDPEQSSILNTNIDSSHLVNGSSGSGKTITAIMQAIRLIHEGKTCLYIAPTSLSLKYVKHAFHSLGLPTNNCVIYKEYEKRQTKVEVLLLDDSHRYTLEQIQKLASLSHYLLLFGDYDSFTSNPACNHTMDDLVKTISCKVFNLSLQYGIPRTFLRLIPGYNESLSYYSTQHSNLPIIAKVPSVEKQCLLVKNITEALSLTDVGILCFSRDLVKRAHTSLNKCGLSVEAYLPGNDGIDTIDLDSDHPKILTIASSVGIHFETVFVIGFDIRTVWINHEGALGTVATRPTDNLFIFYEDELPNPLASISKDLFISDLFNDNSSDFEF